MPARAATSRAVFRALRRAGYWGERKPRRRALAAGDLDNEAAVRRLEPRAGVNALSPGARSAELGEES